MDITPALKKRFAQDCCIPIDIFTEPVFTSRLELYDRFYNTIERYNVFLEMIKERYTTYEIESHAKVTTYRKGECIVTATSESDPDKSASCKVDIVDNSDTGVVDSVTIDQKDLYLSVGSSRQLYVTILPETLEDKRILWGTSDKSLATVQGGRVTAVSKPAGDGTCIITAMSNKDKRKIDTCTVHIVDPVEITGLDFEYHQTELQIGATERLRVNAVPANATSTDFDWKSTNPRVATVESGIVTAVGVGSCGIVALSATNPNLTDTCYILVHDIVPVSQVIITSTDDIGMLEDTVIVGGTRQLKARVLPEKATEKGVIWSSSDTNVLQVDPDTGFVNAVGRGSAVITATSISNSYKYGQCAIQVNPSLFVRDIQVDPTEKIINKEDVFDITALISVGYGIDPKINWSVSEKMLATVEADESSDGSQTSTTLHEQDYYNDYDQVKCKIVSHIKTSPGYNNFVTLNTESSWPVNCTCLDASIYTPEMDGHTMISIKIDKPKFSPLYHFNSAIFNNLDVWENVVSTIGETDNDHIIYSENLLNEVAECCNLSRIEAYGRYILNDFYTRQVKTLIDKIVDSDGKPLVELVYFGTDELVLDTSKLTKIVDLDSSDAKVLCTNRLIKLFHDISTRSSGYSCPHASAPGGKPFPMIIRLFTLYKLKTKYSDTEGNEIIDSSEIDGYVRNIYFEGNQPLEFVGNDKCQLPMLMRAMSYQSIQDDDRKFLHQGLVAQFTDDHTIYVPPISSIPDTSTTIEVDSGNTSE